MRMSAQSVSNINAASAEIKRVIRGIEMGAQRHELWRGQPQTQWEQGYEAFQYINRELNLGVEAPKRIAQGIYGWSAEGVEIGCWIRPSTGRVEYWAVVNGKRFGQTVVKPQRYGSHNPMSGAHGIMRVVHGSIQIALDDE